MKLRAETPRQGLELQGVSHHKIRRRGQRVERLPPSPVPRAPAGADASLRRIQTNGGTQYRLGNQVEYSSSTSKQWLPATVEHIDRRGDMTVAFENGHRAVVSTHRLRHMCVRRAGVPRRYYSLPSHPPAPYRLPPSVPHPYSSACTAAAAAGGGGVCPRHAHRARYIEQEQKQRGVAEREAEYFRQDREQAETEFQAVQAQVGHVTYHTSCRRLPPATAMPAAAAAAAAACRPPLQRQLPPRPLPRGRGGGGWLRRVCPPHPTPRAPSAEQVEAQARALQCRSSLEWAELRGVADYRVVTPDGWCVRNDSALCHDECLCGDECRCVCGYEQSAH
jgi:hypothetical protein